MHRKLLFGFLAVTGACLAFACAKASLDDTMGDDGGAPDGPVTDPMCPQYDLSKDPKHCGSCTKACGGDQICAAGTCKAMCDLPTTKCVADGGSTCIDLSGDPLHCGSCTTKCPIGDPDAAGLVPGTGNPEGGPPMDSGSSLGWQVGSPTCAMSKCGTNCPMGFTACADNICYDLKNFHDNCGMCGTACAMDTEWCTQGHCCAVGQAWCNNACADVLTDKNNCGGCGNVCPNNKPNCISGVCSNAYTYTDNFVANVPATTQCTHWQQWIAGLASSYSGMTISGSNDMVGITCNNAMIVSQMAQALKNQTAYTASCNGHTWSNCNRYNDELWIDPPSQCSGSNCPSPGYIMRACIGNNNPNWGGIKTATCNAPSQTMTLSFF